MIKEYMKQTVEEAAKEYWDSWLKNNPNADKTRIVSLGFAFKAGAEWQSKQSPWISVNERLPEENQKVFVLVMWYGISCIREEKFCRSSNLDTKERWIHGNSIVLAWMPIPSFDDVLERIKEKGD